MYQCLVNYTGAVPAEFYSIKKRPVGMIIMMMFKCMMDMCKNAWSTALDLKGLVGIMIIMIKYMMYKVFECLVNCT